MSGASNRASFGDKISTRTGGSDIFNLGGNYFVSNTGNTIYATTTKTALLTSITQTMMQL
jgi:hypothetical protein